MAHAEGRRDRTAEGVADDDRPFDAALLHQSRDRIGLAGRQRIFAPAALRIAMARPVDEKHFGAVFQRSGKGFVLVPQIAAGAVNEHERRQVGAGRRWQVSRVEPEPADVGQLADVRKAPLDGVGLAGRVANEENEGGKGEKKNGHQGMVAVQSIDRWKGPALALRNSGLKTASYFSWSCSR